MAERVEYLFLGTDSERRGNMTILGTVKAAFDWRKENGRRWRGYNVKEGNVKF